MILSQLMDADELKKLTPQRLRELILSLDDEIKFGADSGEKILVSFEANVVGVKRDKPAGTSYDVKFTKAGNRVVAAAPAKRVVAKKKPIRKASPKKKTA